jgi:uncharacterized membrane protein (DUF106 family)
MVFISLITGLLMLFIFRRTSNQAGIRRSKDRIKAHLLELRLFKENMGVTWRAQGGILRANLRYIGYSFRPLLVMIVPLILILVQMNFWFGYKALDIGEAAILKVRLMENVNPMEIDPAIEAPPSLAVETPPLRLEQEREIDWRIRARSPGHESMVIRVGGKDFAKTVSIAGKPLSRVSPRRVRRSFFDELFFPSEKPLPSSRLIRSIEVTYPAKKLNVLGLRLHWLVAYFILSIVFGFALKRPFKVEI